MLDSHVQDKKRTNAYIGSSIDLSPCKVSRARGVNGKGRCLQSCGSVKGKGDVCTDILTINSVSGGRRSTAVAGLFCRGCKIDGKLLEFCHHI